MGSSSDERRGPSTFRRTPCISCRGEMTVRLAGPPAVLRCARCGLMRVAGTGEPGARGRREGADFRGTDGGRFLTRLESVTAFFRNRRAKRILKHAPGPGRILDVGCGRGIMLERFVELGWRALGTERSAASIEAVPRLRGVEVASGELPDLDLPDAAFEVISFFHVLEHVEFPDRYLSKARSLLKPDGLLVVEVPDHSGIGFRLLGVRHMCVDFPNHRHLFTPESLSGLLGRNGFTVGKTERFSLEYSPFTVLQNLLNALPGEPNILYRSLMSGEEGRRLRREPRAWLHGFLGIVLASPAFAISLLPLLGASGNTMRFYCRPSDAPQYGAVTGTVKGRE